MLSRFLLRPDRFCNGLHQPALFGMAVLGLALSACHMKPPPDDAPFPGPCLAITTEEDGAQSRTLYQYANGHGELLAAVHGPDTDQITYFHENRPVALHTTDEEGRLTVASPEYDDDGTVTRINYDEGNDGSIDLVEYPSHAPNAVGYDGTPEPFDGIAPDGTVNIVRESENNGGSRQSQLIRLADNAILARSTTISFDNANGGGAFETRERFDATGDRVSTTEVTRNAGGAIIAERVTDDDGVHEIAYDHSCWHYRPTRREWIDVRDNLRNP